MIKATIVITIFLIQSFSLKAQETLYDYIQPGNYTVGFMDTLLFDSQYTYEAYDYRGMKPYFIKIWHPVNEEPKNQNPLTFSNFFEHETGKELITVQQELQRHYRETIIRDFIEENLLTGEANNFEPHTNNDVLDLIGTIETVSRYHNKIESPELPVIIYHHGAQGCSFENFAMAEYFASRGFIFISANFHLPFENTVFGLKPFSKIKPGEEEHSLRQILGFVRTLSKSESVFFIGHSWGAQMGLRTFDNDSTIKGLISLETTIEFKTDRLRIKELWPEVFQKVAVDNVTYPFPVLFCASTGEAKPFQFFENINVPHKTFVATKKDFEHNAYASAFYLRYFISNQVKQNDNEILLKSLKRYVKHLEVIHEFIDKAIRNETPPGTEIKFVE